MGTTPTFTTATFRRRRGGRAPPPPSVFVMGFANASLPSSLAPFRGIGRTWVEGIGKTGEAGTDGEEGDDGGGSVMLLSRSRKVGSGKQPLLLLLVVLLALLVLLPLPLLLSSSSEDESCVSPEGCARLSKSIKRGEGAVVGEGKGGVEAVAWTVGPLLEVGEPISYGRTGHRRFRFRNAVAACGEGGGGGKDPFHASLDGRWAFSFGHADGTRWGGGGGLLSSSASSLCGRSMGLDG